MNNVRLRQLVSDGFRSGVFFHQDPIWKIVGGYLPGFFGCCRQISKRREPFAVDAGVADAQQPLTAGQGTLTSGVLGAEKKNIRAWRERQNIVADEIVTGARR